MLKIRTGAMDDTSVSKTPDDQQIRDLFTSDIQELPPVPAVAIKLLQLTADEDVKIAQLSRVIETDPTLAAKILRMVNSAAYQLPKHITSLPHAVTILGFSRIRQIALGLSLYQHLKRHLSSPDFDLFQYWQHCLTVATLAKSLAQTTGYAEPDTAYVAGLLHDIGKLVLEAHGKISYSEIISSVGNSRAVLIKAERKLLGAGHDDVGCYICRKWGLPEQVTTVVKFHHRSITESGLSREDEKLVAIVALANFIAWTQGIGSVNLCCPVILQPEVEEHIELDKLDLPSMLQHLDQEVSEIGKFYQLQFPTSDELRVNLLRATLQLNRINSKTYFDSESSTATVSETLLTPHRSHDPDEIIQMTLEAIHREMHFKTLIYLKADPVSRKLVIMHSHPPEARLMFQDFQVGLTPTSGAFIDCLRTRSPVIANGTTPAEQKTLEQLDTTVLGLAPVAGGGRLMGIVAAIPSSDKQLSKIADLGGLGLVSTELGLALEHAELFQTIKSQADRDSLTGIFNRRSFLFHLERIHEQHKESTQPMAVGMVDVDYFKKVNDQFGHATGDKVLSIVADTMSAVNRSDDLIGRYGGDEFIFALTGVSESGAVLFAERIRKAIENKGKLLAKRFDGLQLSVSIGLAIQNQPEQTVMSLIKDADNALYRAKHQGKNRVII